MTMATPVPMATSRNVEGPVVLFDLDGTALTFEGSPPGPGRTALERAMRQLYAVENATEGLRVAGGTDRALARSMLVRIGASDDDDAIERVIAAYVEQLGAVLQTRRYRPVGEVSATVGVLRARGAIVGVATGNVRAGAALKLASAGLSATFDLAMGGFGCDAEPRAEIVRIAAGRCAAGRSPGAAAAKLVVIGDTVHDVRAGRAVGARVVGVAISEASRHELEAAGADAVTDTCGDELVNAVWG
jgi:phosphoglycolate phosphatase